MRRTLSLIILFLSLFQVCSNHILYANTEDCVQALEKLEAKVIEHTLPNGIKVIMYRRGIAPVFAGTVVVGVGGVDEERGHTGISHMLEHMAFKGTTTFGTSDYKKERKLLDELEEIAKHSKSANEFTTEQRKRWDQINKELAEIVDSTAFDKEFKLRGEVGLNATTDKELTTYFVSLPKNAFEFWAWIESERILNPVMRQFYSERDVVMEERRMRSEDSPEGVLYEKLLETVYEKHHYRNPVIGYPEDITSLTASQTKQFQEKFYVPSNITLSIVGDIDVEADLKVVKKYFSRIPKGPEPTRPYAEEPRQIKERSVVVKHKAEPISFVAYRKPNYPHVDDPAITVLEELLAGSQVAHLQKALVQEQKIASSIDVFEAPGNKFPNLFIFYLVPKAPHTNAELISAFDIEIKKFLKTNSSVEQVESAKRALALSSISDLDSNSSLAQNLASSQMLYGSWRENLAWLKAMLKVTPADVQRVAKQYLVDNQRTIAKLEKVRE